MGQKFRDRNISRLAEKLRWTICNESKAEQASRGCQPVPVLFVTDRATSVDKNDQIKFLNAGDPDGQLRFGVAFVTIPIAPGSRKRNELSLEGIAIFYRETPHLPNSSTVRVGKRQMLNDIDNFKNLLVDVYKNISDQRLFIFVHGYGNSFDSAATRIGLFAEKLKCPGIPILFSWPSADT